MSGVDTAALHAAALQLFARDPAADTITGLGTVFDHYAEALDATAPELADALREHKATVMDDLRLRHAMWREAEARGAS